MKPQPINISPIREGADVHIHEALFTRCAITEQKRFRYRFSCDGLELAGELPVAFVQATPSSAARSFPTHLRLAGIPRQIARALYLKGINNPESIDVSEILSSAAKGFSAC